MNTEQQAASTGDAVRFAFGANWMDYAKSVTEEDIENASRRLTALIHADALKGKTFIDIGCGSGLHALAALRMGVSGLYAIDYDAISVATATGLLAQRWPDTNYQVRQGDILDLQPRPEQADVVYSRGVLHHTGNMNQAIRNAASLVRPKGTLIIALYGKTPYCETWKRIKRWYCTANEAKKQSTEKWYVRLFGVYLLLRGKRLKHHIANYSKKRGMDFIHDVRDWLGGYPYESIAPQELLDLLTPLGFTCVKQLVRRRSGLFGSGCDEYVFIAP